MTNHDTLRAVLAAKKAELRREMDRVRARVDAIQIQIGEVQIQLLRLPTDAFIATAEYPDLLAAAAYAGVVPEDLHADAHDDGRAGGRPHGPHLVPAATPPAGVDGITGSMYDAAGNVIASVTVTGK
jgi:hypothetical protein